MKQVKMSVLVVISLLLSNFLFAQQFALGVKGGVNMGKITGESFKDEYKLGYQIGGFATIPLGRTIAIQPEVLYNQTNADTSNRFSDIYDLGNMKNVELKQLLIPVMINVNLSKLLTLQVGPQFGIAINQDKNLLQNGKDAFKSGSFATAAGLQLNLMKFRVYGRFSGGMTDIDNIGDKDTWKVQNIQLGVGLSLF